MAESGFFRVSFRGFNKQDVLQYIDELQTAHNERLSEVEGKLAEAEKTLADERASVRDQDDRVKELEAANAQLAEQVEKLTALAQIYKTELLSLREQAASNDRAKDDACKLQEALARNRELEDQVALLKEQNARYASVVGDVSRLVVEARVVSASYLDAAQQKSSACIQELDTFLSELKGKVEKVREGAVANRKAGDVHIESLLSDLKELGTTIPTGTND